MRLMGPHWSSVRSSRLQMFFKKRFLKISPISQKNTCAGVSFHCEIGNIFKNTPFLQNTSGGCFWSVFCSNPKASRTYSSVSTVFFTSRRSSYFIIIIFPPGFSFTDTDDSQDSRGRERTIFYSTLALPTAHKHWDIYLQPCMWDDYHVFLFATLVFTRLLLDEIYHLIELPFDWLIDWWCNVRLFTWWIDSRFELQQFWHRKPEDLNSYRLIVLQTNRLTKCAFIWRNHYMNYKFGHS